MFYMQDTTCDLSFYDVSSRFRFIFTPCYGQDFNQWSCISSWFRVSHSLPQGPIIQYLLQLSYCFYRVNVVEGEPYDRLTTTGNHTLRDITAVNAALVVTSWNISQQHYPWLEIHKCTLRFTPLLILTGHVG